MSDLTHREEANLLELSLWGMQAWSEHSKLEPRQFDALISLASDLRVELDRVDEEETAKIMAEHEKKTAPPSEAPHSPLSVVK